MRKWRFLTLLTVLTLLLAACGTSTDTPDPGNPGGPEEPGPEEPGNPDEPGEVTCTVTIDDDVTVMETWIDSDSPCDYYLAGTISVSSQLTIEPGTTIVAGKGTRLMIEDGGRLVAAGTADAPISFIGQLAVQGSWYGLCFNGDQLESTLDHVDIFWAGGVWSGGSHVCRAAIGGVNDGGEVVNITNSRIVGSYTTGIDATEFTLGEFSNNILAGHREYGIRVSPENMPALDYDTNYGGNGLTMPDGSSAANGKQYVYLDSTGTPANAVDEDVQLWKNLGLPYYLNRDDYTYSTSAMWISEDSVILVEPGTHFVAGPGGVLFLIDGGGLFAMLGEEGYEIVFTSEVKVPGAWEGFWLAGGGLLADHVIFEYGGSELGSEQAILGFSWSGFPSHCSDIRNSTVRFSETDGIIVDEDYGPFVHIDEASMTYEDNAGDDLWGTPTGPAVLDEGVTCGGS